ncbi:conjugal transfer protein TraP [Salmonella enterica subsp. enterica serovar Enteritidis str. CDC_2010K_1884]|nr:conjugal transfer protein TraP [Salmonella enterica subsp. enterica serovar Enteritidis str. CDC_2010K_1884]
MGNNRLNSLKGRAVLYRIAGLLRWLIWGVKYAIIWPLATTAIVVILLFRTGIPRRDNRWRRKSDG